MKAVSLSTEPLEGVRDSVIRVLYTVAPDGKSCGSGLAFLKEVKISPLRLILKTGKLHRYQDVPFGRVGV